MEEGASPAGPSQWQEAPMDILGVVLHRASSIPDTARAAAVYRAWRRAVAHLHPPLPPQLPWLLLPDFDLRSLSSDGATAAAHRLPRPDAGVAVPICVGSTGDGRVILLQEHSCFLLNPLSGATTPLPDLDLADSGKWLTIPSFSLAPDNRYRPSPPCKVVLSGSPDSGSGCFVAGISGPRLLRRLHPCHYDIDHHATLFLCRPGAAAWSVTTVRPSWWQTDIAFNNGKLYFFSRDPYPNLAAFDIGEDADGVLKVTRAESLVVPEILDVGWSWSMPSKFYYLVESRGKLLMMVRDFSLTGNRTRAVDVFALDESTGRPEWERTESLGGEIIFLSANSSMSVPSSRYRGGRGDRIYFSQEMYLIDGGAGALRPSSALRGVRHEDAHGRNAFHGDGAHGARSREKVPRLDMVRSFSAETRQCKLRFLEIFILLSFLDGSIQL